jgi:hydroxypyruvate isomerase
MSFKHSVCRWCYQHIPLDDFCREVKAMGFESVELTGPEDWPTLQAHGLTCAIATFPVGKDRIGTIEKAFNRIEHHDELERIYREMIPLVAAAGIKQLILFSGNREGMDEQTGIQNCATGIRRILPYAIEHHITLVMELLNSKVDHPDYMCDHTAWGAALVDEINSPHFRLLYDIYHMQIMEGDVISTIRANIQRISHFHTAGVPGRHEIDSTQELNYSAISQCLHDLGYTGFLGQEFTPRQHPGLDSLADALRRIDITQPSN